MASGDSYHTGTCRSSEQSSRDNHLCLTAGQEQTEDSHLDDVASEVTTEAGNRIQDPYLSRTERDRTTMHRLIYHRVRRTIPPTAPIRIRLQTKSALRTEPTATIGIRPRTESALKNVLQTKAGPSYSGHLIGDPKLRLYPTQLAEHQVFDTDDPLSCMIPPGSYHGLAPAPVWFV